MANDSLLQALFAQAWQLAALAIAVGLAVRYFARNRPHLAHALWLVVLVKCVTPPVWQSPLGVFSWLSPGACLAEAAPEDDTPAVELTANFDSLATSIDGASVAPELIVDARAASVGEFELDEPVEAPSPPRHWLVRPALIVWIGGALALAIIAAVRVTVCWRKVRRDEILAHPELEALVAELTKKLRVRRSVRLLVTASRVGPAVIGLWRPTILLPACVVHGRRAEELEPILAHELIHVRRGDLWVGLLQTVAQALWWFHPLVWIAGRMISREAERCCDEEVIGELRCDPSRYARSLLCVLEWKRILIPAPAAPGVRGVEITSKRLERIMTLGQGCRRRTPWWCWVAMLAVAGLALPGSPLRIQGTEPDKDDSATRPTRPLAIDRVAVSHAPPQSTGEPIAYPPERNEAPDRDKILLSGKRLQAWGVDDLLTMIEKQLHVDHAEAKRALWVRLYCAQQNAENAASSPPLAGPYSSPAAEAAAPAPAATEPALPDGEAYWFRDHLVLSQRPERAKRTEAALAEMRKYGFEEVEFEIRFVTSPLATIADVSSKWTTLPMKPADAAKDDRNATGYVWSGLGTTRHPASAVKEDFNASRAPSSTEANSGVASFAVEKNLPIILDVLGEGRAKTLIDNVQGESRANLLQAPRLRVNNGQSATVLDCSQTPFVVGFQNDKPQIAVVTEGTTVRVRPLLDGDKAHVDFEIVLSGIRNVEEIKTRGPDGLPATIQSPEVAQSRVAATVDVRLGQTVLVGGLKDVRDPKSETTHAVLLTVKKAPLDGHSKKTGEVSTSVRETQAGPTRRDARPGPSNVPSYTIVGPITSGGKAKTLDPPSDEEVVRAVEKAMPASEQGHHNFRVTIERITEYTDPPRVYPLVGQAQLHHARYKCTLYHEEIAERGSRLPQTPGKDDWIEVISVDHTHLHVLNDVDAATNGAQDEKPGDRGKKVGASAEDNVGEVGAKGSTLVSQSVPKTRSGAKPPLLWLFKGEPNDKAIEADVERLVDYYRGLGFFQVHVKNEIEFDANRQRGVVKFVIEEGPRYIVRSISIVGASKIDEAKLGKSLALKAGDFFDQRKMHKDVDSLKQKYSDIGHGAADVQSQPKLDEQAGKLDVVYRIAEGIADGDGEKDKSADKQGAKQKGETTVVGAAKDNARPQEDGAKDDAIFTVTYAVADLVIPFPNPVTITAEKDPKPRPPAKPDFAPLLDLITTTVTPASWTENGGECSVQPFRENLSLVVSQTTKGHEEIAALIKTLRAKLDTQVVLDCRTVDDPAELFTLMKDRGRAIKEVGLSTLPADVVEKAHKMAEAKGGTNFKLTVYNGQMLMLPMLGVVGEDQIKYLMMQATIAEGGRVAQLQVASPAERLLQPWQQTDVRACGSILLDATKFRLPMPAEFGVTPPKSKDGAPAKSVYVLITPRVIHAENAEQPAKPPEATTRYR